MSNRFAQFGTPTDATETAPAPRENRFAKFGTPAAEKHVKAVSLGAPEFIGSGPVAAESLKGAGLQIAEGVVGLPETASRIADATPLRAPNLIQHIGTALEGVSDFVAPVKERFSNWIDQRAENNPVAQNLAAKGQFADQALQDALNGDFRRLEQVVKSPEFISAFVAQGAPSLAVAMVGGLPAAVVLEALAAAENAKDFEASTGQPISDEDFAAAVAATGVIGGLLEKAGIDSIFGKYLKKRTKDGVIARGTQAGKRGALGAAGEAVTEAGQGVVGNAAEKLTYNPDAELTEGVLPGVIGGAGLGGGLGAAGGAIERKASPPPPNPGAGLPTTQTPPADTGAPPSQADAPTPEPPETLLAQIEAFEGGRKGAVLFTPGEDNLIPSEAPPDVKFKAIPEGVLMYRDPKALRLALDGKIGEALNYGIEQKPSADVATDAGAQVVTARDKNGVPIQDVVTDGRKEVVEAATEVAGPEGSVETRPATDALQEREARKQVAGLPRTHEENGNERQHGLPTQRDGQGQGLQQRQADHSQDLRQAPDGQRLESGDGHGNGQGQGLRQRDPNHAEDPRQPPDGLTPTDSPAAQGSPPVQTAPDATQQTPSTEGVSASTAPARHPKSLDDKRLQREDTADYLNAIPTGWDQQGGRGIRAHDDGTGPAPEITDRTKWLPASEAWADAQTAAPLPGNTGGAATKEAIRKAIAGEKMGAAERRHVSALLDYRDGLEEQDAYEEGGRADAFNEAVEAYADEQYRKQLDLAAKAQRVPPEYVRAQAQAEVLLSEDEIADIASRHEDDADYYRALQDAVDAKRQAKRDTPARARETGRQDLPETGGREAQTERAPEPDPGQDTEQVAARDADTAVAPDTTEPLQLEAQTEQSLKDRDEDVARKDEAEAAERKAAEDKAQSERDANDFVLSGSDSEADQAAARGQDGLFAQPENKPADTAPVAEPEYGAEEQRAEAALARGDAPDAKTWKAVADKLVTFEGDQYDAAGYVGEDADESAAEAADAAMEASEYWRKADRLRAWKLHTDALLGDTVWTEFMDALSDAQLADLVKRAKADPNPIPAFAKAVGALYRESRSREDYGEPLPVEAMDRLALAQANLLAAHRRLRDQRLVSPKEATQLGTKSDIKRAIAKAKSSKKAPEKPAPQITDPIEAHTAFMRRAYDGDATLDEYKAAYQRVIDSKPEILKGLMKLTKDQLLKRAGISARKSDKKQSLIDSAYRNMISDFQLGRAISYSFGKGAMEAAMQKQVDATTGADLKAFAERVAKQRAERNKRIEGFKDPKTLDDFDLVVRVKGVDSLTADQLARYDELLAEAGRARKQAKDAREGTVAVSDAGVGTTLIETEHTRDKYPLFVIQLDERVDRDKYNELNAAAKKLGGRYSAYARNGAVPGFQFKDKASAEQFQSVVKGEEVSTAEQREARAETRQAKATNKLAALADKIEAAANESLNADRKTNTAKRAREAAHAEENARAELAFAKTLRNLAAAIESGDAKHLTRLSTKTQVQTLYEIANAARYKAVQAELKGKDHLSYAEREAIRNRPFQAEDAKYVQLPRYVAYKEDFGPIIRELEGRKNTKLLRNRLEKVTASIKGDKPVEISNDLMEQIFEKHGEKDLRWTWPATRLAQKRLAALGIETLPELRAAIREFVQYRGAKQKADPIKEMERALVGRKGVGIDFFPTPASVAADLVEQAEIEPGMRVLEPSAGNGNIATAIREAGVEPDVVEMSSTLADILKAKKFNVVGGDFLQYEGGDYDRIIMNPPFSDSRDIKHVRHAYKLLKPGGRLVAVMGEGAFFRGDKTATAFREWTESLGAVDEKLPEKTFLDPSLPATTGANTRVVVIDKPEARASRPAAQSKATVPEIRAALEARLGRAKLKLLEDSGTLTIVQRARDAGPQFRGAEWSSAKGLAVDGRAILIAGNLTADTAYGVLLHEVGEHVGMRGLLGDKAYGALVDAFQKLVDAGDPTARRIEKHVTDLIERGDMPRRHADSERLAYTAELAATAKASGLSERMRLFIRRLVAAIKARLFADPKLRRFKPKDLTPQDFAALARLSVDRLAREAGTVEGNNSTRNGAIKPRAAKASRDAATDQTRTPAFKKWFGDWELAALGHSMRRVRGSEQAKAARSEIVGKSLVNQESGLAATVSGESYRKMLSQSNWSRSVNAEAHYQALGNLDKLFPLAARMASRDGKGATDAGRLKKIHHFHVPMPFDGDVLRVKMLVKAFTDPAQGNRIYLVEAVEIETPASNTGESASEDNRSPHRPAGVNDRFAQMVAAVKGDDVSRVVDANGEPLVVYHGAPDARFVDDDGVFKNNNEKFGGTGGARAFWFAKDRRVAATYADDTRAWDYQNADPGIVPAYLDLKNPLVVDGKFKHWREAQARGKTSDVIEQAKADGHDGVIIRNVIDDYNNGAHSRSTDTYVVFSSNQIKSADKNSGAFDPENPDIRKSQKIADEFGETMDSVLTRARREAPPRTVLSWPAAGSRPAWLAALTRQQIAEVAADVLPEAQDYVDIAERMTAYKHKLAANSHDVAERVLKFRKKHRRAAAALYDLMHEATIAGADPSIPYAPRYTEAEGAQRIAELKRKIRAQKGLDSQHLMSEIKEIEAALRNEPKRKETHAALRTKFEKLPSEAQLLFRVLRDEYVSRFEAIKLAIEERIERAVDDGSVVKALKDEVRLEYDKRLRDGPYFPLFRQGRYWASAQRKGDLEPDEVRHFKSEREQYAWIKLKESEGFEVTSGTKEDAPVTAESAFAKFSSRIDEIVANQSLDRASDIKDALHQMYLEALPDLSARKHFIHRKKRKGFSTDALQAYADYMFHSGNHLARIEYADRMESQLTAMEEAIKGLRDRNKAQDILNELKKRHQWAMNPDNHVVAQKLTGAGFFMYLSVSPAAAMVNMTQTALVTAPVMASKYGWARTEAALANAAKDYFLRNLNPQHSKKMPAEEKRLMRDLMEAGKLDVTNAHSLAGLAESPSSIYKTGKDRIFNAAAYFFHEAEVFNRSVSAAAAFRVARSKGASYAEAAKYAGEIIDTTHFNYGNDNRARIMQGNIQKVAFQFKQYSQAMIYTIVRKAYVATRGLDKAKRKEARRALRGVLMMHALAGGASAVFGYSAIVATLNAAASFGDDDDEYTDLESEFWTWLAEETSPEFAKLVRKGPVNAKLGADLSRRISLDQLVFRSPDRDLEGYDLAYHWLEQVAGPSFGTFKNVLVGLQRIGDGQYQRGVESMMPKFARDIIKSERFLEEGARTLSGQSIVDDFEQWELTLQAAGFTPSRLSDKYELRTKRKNFEQHVQKRRRQIMDNLNRAADQGDRAELAKWNAAAVRFSQRYPEKAITFESRLRSRQSRANARARSIDGANLDAKLAPRITRDINY